MTKKTVRLIALVVSASTAFVSGCSPQELQTLEGQLFIQNGGPFEFAGDTIELRSQSDAEQYAFGEIKPDGTFKIDSLEEGKVAQGAKPGVYAARIVISDDDYDHKKLAAKSINKKYLSFETSGLSVTVPSSGLKLPISK